MEHASGSDRPALSGFDAVSYHAGAPLRGSGEHAVHHEGSIYVFANEANQRAFELDPARYLPAFDGGCAFGVALGERFEADPQVWAVVDGRLYLNKDAGVQARWSADRTGMIARADRNWARMQTDPRSGRAAEREARA